MNRIRSRSQGSRRDTTVSDADAIRPRRPGTEHIPRAEVRRRLSISGENSISLFNILQSRDGERRTSAVRAAIQRSEEIQAMPRLIAAVESVAEQAQEVKFDQRDYDEVVNRDRPQRQPKRNRNHVRGQQPTRTQPTRGNGKQPAAATSSSPPLSSSEQDEKDEAVEQVVQSGSSTVRAGKQPASTQNPRRQSTRGNDKQPPVAISSSSPLSSEHDEENEATEQVVQPDRPFLRAGKLSAIKPSLKRGLKRGLKRKRNESVSGASDGNDEEQHAVKVEDQEGVEQVDKLTGEVEDGSRAAIRAGKLPAIQKRGIKRQRNNSRDKVEDKEDKEDKEHESFCFCRDVEHGYMISCDGCNEWFHGPCVNMTKERGEEMVALQIGWLCRLCNPVQYQAPPALLPVTRGEVWRAIPPEGVLISELVATFFERIDKVHGSDGWTQIVGPLVRKASDVPHVGELGGMRVVRREKRDRTIDDRPGPSTRTNGTAGNSRP